MPRKMGGKGRIRKVWVRSDRKRLGDVVVEELQADRQGLAGRHTKGRLEMDRKRGKASGKEADPRGGTDTDSGGGPPGENERKIESIDR